jgi:hypothetical protein
VVQIRAEFGFRESTRADEDRLIAWLAEQVCPSELGEAQQKEALLARRRVEQFEPPGRIERIISSANTAADDQGSGRRGRGDGVAATGSGPHGPGQLVHQLLACHAAEDP